MRRVLLTLSFWLLALGFVNAQEAFYIYRNDGDFNGFFYDEVVEMRQSKIGVDSVEYDKWVTQEVVLADTTYRIPLAAIDSIGFQQPEIKLGPKVKFVEKEGLAPYIDNIGSDAVVFRDIPEHLIPQIGDVLIGLPTDAIAEDKYKEKVGCMFAGSFSCVVTSITSYTMAGHEYTNANGHPVDQIGDVFEQYITVEQIGMDKQGNIRRRVAGCTPDGLPSKIKKEEGQAEVSLIDFTGNVSRQWQPVTDVSIDFSAEVSTNLKLRVAYNITWKRFYVKLTKDLVVSAKPNIGLTLSKSWEGTPGALMDVVPGIGFPSFCPIFETKPLPELFIRAAGNIDARITFPKVRLGFGDDIIMDSNQLFPLWYSMHLVPDESQEVPQDMFNSSAELLLSGWLQLGVKFSAPISTNSWFKKVLFAETGCYLYVGPKIGGEIHIPFREEDGDKVWDEDKYFWLMSSHFNIALLSIDLEAKAKAAAFWNDPEEKTFFSRNWSFLTDTTYFAMGIDRVDVLSDVNDKRNTIVQLFPRKAKFMGYTTLKMKLYNYQKRNLVAESDEVSIAFSNLDSIYEFNFRDLEWGQYLPVINIKCGSHGPYDLKRDSFWPVFIMEPDRDSVAFGVADNLQQTVTFKTNCQKEYMSVIDGDWLHVDSIEVVDKVNRIYKVTIVADKNNSLFDRKSGVTIRCRVPSNEPGDGYKTENLRITCYQEENNLQDVSIIAEGWFKQNDNTRYLTYNDRVTATRIGKDDIDIEGTSIEDNPGSGQYYTSTYNNRTVRFHVKRVKDADGSTTLECSNGYMSSHYSVDNYRYTLTRDVVMDFGNWFYSDGKLYGKLTSATYDEELRNKPGYNDREEIDIHETMSANDRQSMVITFKVKTPTTTTP